MIIYPKDMSLVKDSIHPRLKQDLDADAVRRLWMEDGSTPIAFAKAVDVAVSRALNLMPVKVSKHFTAVMKQKNGGYE